MLAASEIPARQIARRFSSNNEPGAAFLEHHHRQTAMWSESFRMRVESGKSASRPAIREEAVLLIAKE